MEYKTPQDVADEKARAKADAAYSKSLRMTEEAPKKDPRDAVRGQKAYKAGGFVRAADGIAKRGKTKGRML